MSSSGCLEEYLPKRSLHPPMKQSTRMLGTVLEMEVILIQLLVSVLMWLTASAASVVLRL